MMARDKKGQNSRRSPMMLVSSTALALLLGACGDGSPPNGERVGEGGVVEGGAAAGGGGEGPRADGEELMPGPQEQPLKPCSPSEGGVQNTTQSQQSSALTSGQRESQTLSEPEQPPLDDLVASYASKSVTAPIDYVAGFVPTAELTISTVPGQGNLGKTSRILKLLVDPSSTGVRVFYDAVADLNLRPLAADSGRQGEILVAASPVRGANLVGAVTRAHVTFGGVTTHDPIPLQLIGLANLPQPPLSQQNSDIELRKFAREHGIDGILGIGPSDPDSRVASARVSTAYYACSGDSCLGLPQGVEYSKKLVALSVVLADQQKLFPASILSLGSPEVADHTVRIARGSLSFGAELQALKNDHLGGAFTPFSGATDPLDQLRAELPAWAKNVPLAWPHDAGVEWERLLGRTLVIVGPSNFGIYGTYRLESNRR